MTPAYTLAEAAYTFLSDESLKRLNTVRRNSTEWTIGLLKQWRESPDLTQWNVYASLHIVCIRDDFFFKWRM